MKTKTWYKLMLIAVLTGIICVSGMMPLVFADVYINVMAVNGAPERKETSVKYNLPGDLRAEDILDTNGLKLEYNVNDANYYVSGSVALDPKESKTFRIRIKDVWKTTPEQTDQIKEEINKGFEQIGKAYDAASAQALKDKLIQRIDYISQQQNSADSVEKRMDAFRSYRNELARIRDQALAVDYWKSNPQATIKDKVVRFKIDAENPTNGESKVVKQKQYLPSEIKPQDIIDADGFEIRYDQQKQQAFLFKEEEIPQGEKKSHTISIRDIWYISQEGIDYLRKRGNYANDFLKNSKYAQSSQLLLDQAEALLKTVEESQKLTVDISEHISAFRVNDKSFNEARIDIENIEKLLALYREDLEKSKVENVLQKVRSLKGVADISKQVFDKKPTPSTTWSFIGWVLLFVGVLSVVYLVVLLIRSQGKKALVSGAEGEGKKTEELKK